MITVRMSAPVLALQICMSIGLGVPDVTRSPVFVLVVWTAETMVPLDSHTDCSIVSPGFLLLRVEGWKAFILQNREKHVQHNVLSILT